MSDATLLAFGCCVTFIGIAGAYVYIRECFTGGDKRPAQQEVKRPKAIGRKAEEAA